MNKTIYLASIILLFTMVFFISHLHVKASDEIPTTTGQIESTTSSTIATKISSETIFTNSTTFTTSTSSSFISSTTSSVSTTTTSGISEPHLVQDSDGSYYLCDDNGNKLTGWRTVNGKRLYFSTQDGELVKDTIFKIHNAKFATRENGEKFEGWKTAGENKLYFLSDGQAVLNNFRDIKDDTYYFSSEGYMEKGFQEIKGDKYYLGTDGKLKKGWFEINGEKYRAMNESGKLLTSAWFDEGKLKYRTDRNGKLMTGWFEENGRRYYGDNNGVALHWRDIDGSRYYFGSNGIMRTDWQFIDYKAYYFRGDGTLDPNNSGNRGVDLSKYNGNVDFYQLKASGINFVILRAGTGKSGKDPTFEENYRKAKNAGLHVGAYWYTYASSTSSAIDEARRFESILSGKKFDYPVFLDIEERWQVNAGMGFFSSIIQSFCDELRSHKYYVGFYTSKSYLRTVCNDYVRNNYPVWAAQWGSKLKYDGKFIIWQNSSTSIVPGVSGHCDTNYSYAFNPSTIFRGGYNGY